MIAMTRTARDIQRKQKILKHAEETGHVASACRYFGDAINALDQCDRDCRHSSGGRPALLVYRVVCTDEEALNWKADDIGNLRVALNALVRVFRLDRR
jgi:hypothetical protein